MRTLRLILVLVGLVALPACNGESTPPPRDDARREGTISIWTANLEHLLPEHDWTEFVHRVAADAREPDLLFLSELTEPETTEVVESLEEEAGLSYEFEHAPIGNNAVVWNEERLDQQSDETPLLWEPFGAAGCSEPSDSDPSEVIGVRLTEAASGTQVAAVGVHWGRTWAAECMEKNMVALDEQIEQRWPDRPLTVVAGDLNAHPDKQPVPGEPGAESLASGRETDPDCWYRSFSVLHDQQLEVARPEEDDRDCANNRYYAESADSYIDAVSATNDPPALCEQWTSVHGGPVAGGSSCTDLNEDGLRDRGRIDYIWLRWEDDAGEVSLPSESEAQELIERAGADEVCILESCAEVRYSDHRAVFAEVFLESLD